MNLILSIDTSCDETSAAVTDGHRVLSNVISSQINLHKKYGGVFPALAKRAHQERIDYVINEALKRASVVLKKEGSNFVPISIGTSLDKKEKKLFQISNFKFQIAAVAVTQGPGLAIALEVGIKKAKELAASWQLPLIAVNHLEGHIYSCLAQKNTKNVVGAHHDAPANNSTIQQFNNNVIQFPALCLIVSGGHTELVLMEDHLKYKVIGATLDDACGEALDKGARILKLGYPGGPIIEKLSENVETGHAPSLQNKFLFNKPLKDKKNLNFSYSGLKTQLLYRTENMSENEFNSSLNDLAASFQSACFEQIIRKTSIAIKLYQPKTLLCGGGVIANKHLRKLIRGLKNDFAVKIYFPQTKKLVTDNAAMIGIVARYKLIKKDFVKNIEELDREPRLRL